jgi:hypothetical protein
VSAYVAASFLRVFRHPARPSMTKPTSSPMSKVREAELTSRQRQGIKELSVVFLCRRESSDGGDWWSMDACRQFQRPKATNR